MTKAAAVDRWKDAILPDPGSANYALSNLHIFTYHQALEFKKTGQTLVYDSTDYMRSMESGNDFLANMLKLDGGGFLLLSGHTRLLILLFINGAILLDLSESQDCYKKPDMAEKIRVMVNWSGSAAFDQEVRQALAHLIEPLTEERGGIFMMVSTSKGPEFRAIGHGGDKLVRENYSPDVLKNYDRISESLRAKVPPGRINILSGPPGTGKTFLVRGLIEEVPDVRFAIVQASHIEAIANPGTLPALISFRRDDQPVVFIIEDAEEVLTIRDTGNNSAVSALLNLGDGVLGSLFDLRIVATTNTKITDLDPAIRRPGRLSTICDVGPLPWGQAAAVFYRLTQKVFEGSNEFYTIAEIYQLATDSGWRGEVKPPRRMGFTRDPIEILEDCNDY